MKAKHIFLLATIVVFPMLLLAQTINQSQVISVGGGTSTGAALTNFAVLGEPFVAYHTSGSTLQSNDGFIYRISDATLLSLTLYLEGLFNGTGLNKAKNATGNQFPEEVADQIKIELHNSENYASIEYSVANVNLSTTGQASVSIPADNSGFYYLSIKHRNSLETVSSQPLTLSGGTKNYNFTTANSQSYGNNLKLMSGVYCIFAGDVNADGYVNTTDINTISNGVLSFESGYFSADLNGDGIVDALDLIMVDNNAASFVKVVKP